MIDTGIALGFAGTLATLLAWLRAEVGQRLSSEAIIEALENANTIRGYLDWLRRQDDNALKGIVAEQRQETIDYLHQLAPALEHAFNVVLKEGRTRHARYRLPGVTE